MENASQALIMAGGVLLAIIIISIGVYLFSKAAALPENYNATLEQQKLEAFNNKFEVYDKEDVSAQDIVTVTNMAIENNRNYEENEVDYYIKVYLDGRLINDYTEIQKVELMQNTSEEEEEDLYSYKCNKIEYSSNSGRVISIKFIKK